MAARIVDDEHASLFGAGPDLVDVGEYGRAARARAQEREEQVAIDDAARREQLERERQEMRDIVADGTDEDFIAWLRRRAGLVEKPAVDSRLEERQAPWMQGERRELLLVGLRQIAEFIAGTADDPRRREELWRVKRPERWASIGHALSTLVTYERDTARHLRTKDRLPSSHARSLSLEKRKRYGTEIQETAGVNTPAELSLVEDLVHVRRAIAGAFDELPQYDAAVFDPAQRQLALVLRYAFRWDPGDIAAAFEERDRIGEVRLSLLVTPRQVGRMSSFGARRAYAYLRPRGLVPENQEWERRMRMDEHDAERRAQLGRNLVGWEAIAAHLGKGDRTVRRYAEKHGMPVFRVACPTGTVTEASSSQIDEWWRTHGWNVEDDQDAIE